MRLTAATLLIIVPKNCALRLPRIDTKRSFQIFKTRGKMLLHTTEETVFLNIDCFLKELAATQKAMAQNDAFQIKTTICI